MKPPGCAGNPQQERQIARNMESRPALSGAPALDLAHSTSVGVFTKTAPAAGADGRAGEE